MAIVNEVVAVCRSVLDVVSRIEDVNEGWFTASVEYQTEATILRAVLTNYEEQVRIHQQPADSTMMRTLKKAESILKRAEARLKSLEDKVNSDRCCSPFWWLYARMSVIFLPEILENTLKKVNEELDRIPKVLNAEKDISALMQDADERRAISTTIHNNDNKYVPIERSQSEVIKAIEDIDGPLMILLHGGVGKGKSTLARYMCERYGLSGAKKGIFDHVIVVPCGNSTISDLATKQYEILADLSPTSLTEKTDSKNVGSKSRIERAFKSFFMGKKLLMILDNVGDTVFLYKMWEAAKDGKDDKILITSLRSNICDDFKNDSVLIKMGAPKQEEARKILASLVGLENQTIPTHLQRVADKMIQATDGNPLALACLATNFACNPDKRNKRDWDDAWRELSTKLAHKVRAIVLGPNDETASRSLWETMKRCIDSLETKSDAMRTLLVIYACKGESVPEEVLRILCDGLQMSSSTFTRSRDELCMNELLKPSSDTLASRIRNLDKMEIDEDSQPSRAPAWCLQSLVKLYMESHVAGKKEIRDVVGALLGDEDVSHESNIKSKLQDCDTETVETQTEIVECDETRVKIALCALYFKRDHKDEVVTRAVTKACQLSNLVDSDDDINDLRRKAIEPLIWMLDKPEEEEQWTEMDKCCVRKVVLEYICKRQLDNENISYLLQLPACPSAQLATLVAIRHISSIEEERLLTENTISLLHALLDLLNSEERVHTVVQEAASRALRSVCWKATYDKSTSLVASVPAVLDVLAQSLANPKSDEVAENVIGALANLSYQADDVKGIILGTKGVIASLVNCLHQQGKPTLQAAAAGALRNLTCNPDSSLQLRIANAERAIVGLVDCLSKHDNCDLQIHAALILGNLAISDDGEFSELQLRIANEKGALVGLVDCLSKDDNHELQKAAALAFCKLAGSKLDCVKLAVANEKGALVGLVECLSKHDNRDLQIRAALTLGNLAVSDNREFSELQLRIANEKGSLVGLVACLSKDDNHELQRAAAWAFTSLARSKLDCVKLAVANEKGALVGLVECLSKHDNRDLQTYAAAALAHLAFSEDGENSELQLRIANEKGALVGLVDCLSKDDNHELQCAVAWAFTSLAGSKLDSVKLAVANEKGALVGLVYCLSKHDNRYLQKAGAWALRRLAGSKLDSVKLAVANEKGALVGLVDCLSKHGNCDLQICAAVTLGDLAVSDDGEFSELQLRIANEKGALVGLVDCLSKDDNHELQGAASWALRRLARSKLDSVKLAVANEKGALVGRVECLLKHDNHDLQICAAVTLGNLVVSDDGEFSELQLRVANEKGALVGLVDCLSKDDNHELQGAAAWALRRLAGSKLDSVKLAVANEKGALVGLVSCWSNRDKHELQTQAAWALTNLAVSIGLKLRIVNEEGVLGGLVSCLSKVDHSDLQRAAVWMTLHIARIPEAKAILKGTEGILEGLTSLVGDNVRPEVRNVVAKALLIICPTRAKEVGLFSAQLENASALSVRIFAKAQLGDIQGALDDANEALKMRDVYKPFFLQERGILKRLMGDLDGSLADLDEGLKLTPNDYEMLKHRGLVKSLKNDVEGARADAAGALSIESSKGYGDGCLGTTPAEYLGYKL